MDKLEATPEKMSVGERILHVNLHGRMFRFVWRKQTFQKEGTVESTIEGEVQLGR